MKRSKGTISQKICPSRYCESPLFYSAFTPNSINCEAVGLLWLIFRIVVFGILGVVAIAGAVIGWLTLVGTWLSYRATRNSRTIRKQRSYQAGG
jgi:hypothetical protein